MSHLTGKTFGVELEFIAPRHYSGHDVAEQMQAAGISCQFAGYTHTTTRHWKVVTDGSVAGNGTPLEIVSPVLEGEAGLAEARKVCETLTRLGATVNQSCGLHVHVGARSLGVNVLKHLAKIYAECEDVIDSVQPHSRRARNNTYCGPVKNLNWTSLAQAIDARDIASAINGGGRYCKLNYTAFWKHGTVEFRHHAGTVDGEKVVNWVNACLRMIAAAQREATEPMQVVQQEPVISNLRLRRIYDMVKRPEGASREEIARMLGRNTAPPVSKILTNANLRFEVRRGRYYAVVHSAPSALTRRPTATLVDFATRLEMSAAELAFWQVRRARLASADPATRVA